MGRWVPALLWLFVAIVGTAFIESAHAQAARTWVSGVGDDANPCSRTAPCKTFAGAISKTAALGEINCLDPSGYGAVTITKSITIDCTGTFGSILNAGTNGVVINFDSFSDARKTVRLRNLAFNGFDTGLNGIRILGTATSAGSVLLVDTCVIDGDFGGAAARGISDERTGGGELHVTDTTIRNVSGVGIFITPGTARIDVMIDNVRILNSRHGYASDGQTRATINRTVFAGNSTAGLQANSPSEVHLANSVISSNATGILTGGVFRLSNNDITFNTTGITGASQSFGNNRIAGNGSAGTAPTLIGANSPPFGQQ